LFSIAKLNKTKQHTASKLYPLTYLAAIEKSRLRTSEKTIVAIKQRIIEGV